MDNLLGAFYTHDHTDTQTHTHTHTYNIRTLTNNLQQCNATDIAFIAHLSLFYGNPQRPIARVNGFLLYHAADEIVVIDI